LDCSFSLFGNFDYELLNKKKEYLQLDNMLVFSGNNH